MTKLRYSFGGGCVRQPCAGCTGDSYECSTEPLERLPILGGRRTHNDERNPTGTALAGNKLGTDHGLLFAGSRQHAPRGQYRRRVGSCADGGADGKSSSFRILCRHQIRIGRQFGFGHLCTALGRESRYSWWRSNGTSSRHWRQPANAHRKQVHSLLYVAAHWLTQKGVAV